MITQQPQAQTAAAKPARFHAPYFRVEATAAIYFPETTSYQPDVRLKVGFFISHRDDQYRSGISAAESALGKLGVSDERINSFTIEIEATEYIACGAKYMRNRGSEPVQAFWNPEKKDEARLIKQWRLVPESHRHMVEIYGPKPAPAAATPEAATCATDHQVAA